MTERGLFFVKLSRFAGVSEALAEREPAGEIPSAAEGSLRAGLFSRCATILQSVPFLKSRSRNAGEGCLWSRFAGVSEAGASGSPSAPADGVRVRRRNPERSRGICLLSRSRASEPRAEILIPQRGTRGTVISPAFSPYPLPWWNSNLADQKHIRKVIRKHLTPMKPTCLAELRIKPHFLLRRVKTPPILVFLSHLLQDTRHCRVSLHPSRALLGLRLE